MENYELKKQVLILARRFNVEKDYLRDMVTKVFDGYNFKSCGFYKDAIMEKIYMAAAETIYNETDIEPRYVYDSYYDYPFYLCSDGTVTEIWNYNQFKMLAIENNDIGE